MSIILQAAKFAERSHGTQRRKYGGRPYIEHPGRVAARVSRCPWADDNAVCIAWLHDVIEDTPCTIQDLYADFNATIALGVSGLTNPSHRYRWLRREDRKRMDRDHIATLDWQLQCIKAIDRTDNLRDMLDADPEFTKLFCDESRLLMTVLDKVSASLMAELNDAINHNLGVQSEANSSPPPVEARASP